jgi:hypothetical protein
VLEALERAISSDEYWAECHDNESANYGVEGDQRMVDHCTRLASNVRARAAALRELAAALEEWSVQWNKSVDDASFWSASRVLAGLLEGDDDK